MNFKKIALVVAMTTSLSAHAVLDDITGFAANDMVSGEEISALSTTVYGDFVDATIDGTNEAYVIQTSGTVSSAVGGSVAVINQVDGNNYAIAMQQGVNGLVYINQTGGTVINKAFVVQIDTSPIVATTPRAVNITTEIGSKTAPEVATAEFMTPTTLSTNGSTAWIAQVADGSDNTATIYQNGTKLLGIVSQESGAAAGNAYIVQVGQGMRGYIRQQ